jgi:hypothetical protein
MIENQQQKHGHRVAAPPLSAFARQVNITLSWKQFWCKAFLHQKALILSLIVYRYCTEEQVKLCMRYPHGVIE